MKKVLSYQSKFLKEITHTRAFCAEYGAGSTYRAELRILFMGKNGILKSINYLYTLKNIHKLLDSVFLPICLDKRIKHNLKNCNTKRF